MTNEFLTELRCPGCQSSLLPGESPGAEGALTCPSCLEVYPVINGIPRMLPESLRRAVAGAGAGPGEDRRQVATARSFGFEWAHFPEMYPEWEHNFREYMAPRGPEFFRHKRVLDAGCGAGRHAYYAAKYGAKVWAIDLGPAVEVARRNTSGCGSVQVVQADLHRPPFVPESFDFIYSLGVLHHLPDLEAALRALLRYLKPGGEIQIYLYWRPEGRPLKQALLGLVAAARRLTSRLPHRVAYGLSFPAACLAWGCFVWPYQLLSRAPGCRRLAERIPMRQYASYPFRVCVNDQLDRLSAPIEKRYTRAEVEACLKRAGLVRIEVRPNWGWCGTGVKPILAPAADVVRPHLTGEQPAVAS